jgi:hypothetical protein
VGNAVYAYQETVPEGTRGDDPFILEPEVTFDTEEIKSLITTMGLSHRNVVVLSCLKLPSRPGSGWKKPPQEHAQFFCSIRPPIRTL